MSAKIISINTIKGGVGKTTTAVSLAGWYSKMGQSVLLVDLDGQGSATYALGAAADALGDNMAYALLDAPTRARPEQAQGTLDLFVGSSELFQADLRFGAEFGRERLLTRALAPFREKYDFIFLDCPPSWNLLSVNAIVAADYYLVPVQPHYLCLEGVRELVGGIFRIKEGIGQVGELLGFLPTLVDHRTPESRKYIDQLGTVMGRKMLTTQIPVNIQLARAPSFGRHIFDFDPGCPGAKAYRELAAELQKRIQQRGKSTTPSKHKRGVVA